ncbi:hypothetical protein N7492_008517 [Penicillium capsulatum]|uniref:Uncharacterized protein n=1 Tax=Penicillium capsulatum TaxID=69766 RepID=A0A9W9LGV0_9EURO|nr:hypothetical protein N7492_008517 [Penicillium capsulatum]KAJ6105918.1 hypothetical protein N7512_009435 [Penicillium capsulatum]
MGLTQRRNSLPNAKKRPFLAYKQKYKALNNSIMRYGGDASDKHDFFRNIASTRKEAFTPSIIRSGFRNYGIWPFNLRVILDKLKAKEPQYPDLDIFGDNTGWLMYLQSQADKPPAVQETLPQANGQKVDCLHIAGPRDVAVREYSLWHEANVSDDGLKAQYRQACEVALAYGLDLELIHEDQDPSFFADKGIMVGIARRFVRDIGRWVRDVRNILSEEETAQAAN